jgi:hypothetical protein
MLPTHRTMKDGRNGDFYNNNDDKYQKLSFNNSKLVKKKNKMIEGKLCILNFVYSP